MSDEQTRHYTVILTDEAFSSYVALPTARLFAHVDKDLGLLETLPYLGQAYDPAYDAARPPFECRVLYCEHYGIYYRVNEEARTVTIFAIEDQRRNPLGRFASYEYSIMRLDEPDTT